MPLQIAKASIYRHRLDRLQVDLVDRFDESFDDLLDGALDWNMVQPFRSSAHLTWKFTARPCGKHFTLVARERGSVRIRGYMVVKLMVRPGVARWADIADFVVRPDDYVAFSSLLNEAIRLAILQDIDFVRLRYIEGGQIPLGAKHVGIQCERSVDRIAFHSNTPGVVLQLNRHSWALTALISDRIDHGGDEWGL
jgi:hypothetical protein